jgi:NADH-quinone oxidoreductase subunit K
VINLTGYLIVSAVLFAIGFGGIIICRTNLLKILLCLELMLIAAATNFIVFAFNYNDLGGQIFTLFILTVAAAETAIGLALIIVVYRKRGTIAVDEINLLKD